MGVVTGAMCDAMFGPCDQPNTFQLCFRLSGQCPVLKCLLWHSDKTTFMLIRFLVLARVILDYCVMSLAASSYTGL